MNGSVLFKFAASALVIGIVAVGCTPGGSHVASVSSAPPPADRQAASQASQAARALREHKLDDAVRFAEAAVALSPQDAAYRAQLGQTYLQAGRFTSAEASFRDALALSPDDGRSALNLALAETALGKTEAARDRLAGLQGKVPDADRGLALALAGDKEGAVVILEAAARRDGADAKTRQNLALAYALAGRWPEAQSTAAQDLPPQELFARLQQWALFAQPNSSWDQVAQLLNVTPVNDPGQPAALALAASPTAPAVAVAEAEPDAASLPAPMVAEAPVAAPVELAAANLPADTPVAPPADNFVEARPPVPAEAPIMRAPVRATRVAAVPATLRAPAPSPQSTSGRYVVQLGAFSSAQRVEAAWNRYNRRGGKLVDYTPSSAVFRRSSGVVHRLTLSGFQTRDAAVRVCLQIKARGNDCFVRTAAGEQPVQWVSRGGGGRGAAR